MTDSDGMVAPSEPADGELSPDQVTEPVLPDPVRQRVVALASSALGGLPDDQLPAPLRRIAKFAPNRRARLGGRPIATQLSTDPVFRQRVAESVAAADGDLAAAVRAGDRPAAADPVELAALAYLLRPAGWLDLVAAVTEAVRVRADSDAVTRRIDDAERRAADADHARSTAQAEVEKLRAELSEQRTALDSLRTEQRTLSRGLRETEKRARRAEELLATEKGRAHRATADHEAELRRLRTRVADAEAAVAASRSATREGRAVDDARLWLLLETLTGAARGLSRELALDPADRTPADFVAASHATTGGTQPTAERALAADDPARLDALLALPMAHLVVDGYNVTKTGYGELSLEQQRNRLVQALAVVAAQTGAEVTCVFDGAERVHGLPAPPRGVRVLFSHKGETADEVIRRLVRAEPDGRPVVVVSSDREVADGVRRHGAYPLSAHTLLRRLARA
jgi:predicted RNA-binding protein with PIN domain